MIILGEGRKKGKGGEKLKKRSRVALHLILVWVHL